MQLSPLCILSLRTQLEINLWSFFFFFFLSDVEMLACFLIGDR